EDCVGKRGIFNDRNLELADSRKGRFEFFAFSLGGNGWDDNLYPIIAQGNDLPPARKNKSSTLQAACRGRRELPAHPPPLHLNERIAFGILHFAFVLGLGHTHVLQEEAALHEQIDKAYDNERDARCYRQRFKCCEQDRNGARCTAGGDLEKGLYP